MRDVRCPLSAVRCIIIERTIVPGGKPTKCSARQAQTQRLWQLLNTAAAPHLTTCDTERQLPPHRHRHRPSGGAPRKPPRGPMTTEDRGPGTEREPVGGARAGGCVWRVYGNENGKGWEIECMGSAGRENGGRRPPKSAPCKVCVYIRIHTWARVLRGTAHGAHGSHGSTGGSLRSGGLGAGRPSREARREGWTAKAKAKEKANENEKVEGGGGRAARPSVCASAAVPLFVAPRSTSRRARVQAS